jgi:peptidyl-prolyl cis-trans isomerase SurA
VVATYDGETITLDAFEREYARTVGSPAEAADDSLAAYQDFLERYVDFRLKVLEARNAGMAEDERIQEEMDTYRSQLARPYLLEQEVTEPLLRDLYEKQELMVDASHILIRLNPEPAPQDTLAAFNEITAIRDSLQNGADFGQMAFRHSEDPSAQREGLGYLGRLGYFSAGRMVKAFEDMAYETPVGSVSPVFRTRFGYHLLHVHDRTGSKQDVRVAHIMVRPADTTEVAKQTALAKIKTLRSQFENGEPFADLARQFSDDQASAPNGGDLGFIKYDSGFLPVLKEAAFALDSTDTVTELLETQNRNHLLQLTGRNDQPTYEEAYDELKGTLARLPRSQEALDRYSEQVLIDRAARVDSALVERNFAATPGDSVLIGLANRTLPDDVWPQSFGTLGDSSYTFGQLSAYAAASLGSGNRPPTPAPLDLAAGFLKEKAIDYEVAALEERDESFRKTMQEFRDGLLLFRLMEDSVWSAASLDTTALEAYHASRADQYRFPDRTRIVSFSAPADSALTALAEQLDAGEAPATLRMQLEADSTSLIRVDTTFLSGQTNSIFDQALLLPEGGHTEPASYNRGYILMLRDGIDPARQKTFTEARAEVINDYQALIEAELIARLRAKYNAETYPERLQDAYAHLGAASGQPSNDSPNGQ